MVWNYQNADCSLRRKFYCHFGTLSFPIYGSDDPLQIIELDPSKSTRSDAEMWNNPDIYSSPLHGHFARQKI